MSCAAKKAMSRPGRKDAFVARYATKGKNTGKDNNFFGHKHTKDTIQKLSKMDKSHLKTASFKKKMSQVTAGPRNPMYGKTCFDIWKSKYGEKEAQEKLKKTKAKLSNAFSGSNNPMYGKPSPQGAGCGWSGWYKNWYFRSLKELSYVIKIIEPTGRQWEGGESLHIKYTSWDGRERTYSPDFIVGNDVVEVKPCRLASSLTVRLKQKAAEEYCRQNNLSYIITDVKSLTDDEIRCLHQNGTIVFIDRYEKMYKLKYQSDHL